MQKEVKEKELKLDIDEAERLRRSDLAKKLHAEGKFGGAQKGSGRPKKPRAQEIVAEKVRSEAPQIFKALKAALNSDSPTVRLKAALSMLEIEQKEEEFMMKREDRLYDKLDKVKLLELISQRINQLGNAGVSIPGFDFESEAKEVSVPYEAHELPQKQLNA